MVLGEASEKSVLLGLLQFQQIQLFVVDAVLFPELLLRVHGSLAGWPFVAGPLPLSPRVLIL